MYIYREGCNSEGELKDMIRDYVSHSKQQTEVLSDRYGCARGGELCLESQNGWIPLGLDAVREAADWEQKQLRSLYSGGSAAILPCISACVDELDYDNSPIYDSLFSRETLDMLVNTVKSRMDVLYSAEAHKAADRSGYHQTDRRDLIEALLLYEIFGNRRAKRRCWNGQNHYNMPPYIFR